MRKRLLPLVLVLFLASCAVPARPQPAAPGVAGGVRATPAAAVRLSSPTPAALEVAVRPAPMATATAGPTAAPAVRTQASPTGVVATAPAQQAAWPTTRWPVSTPEEQGLDSSQLARVFDTIHQQHAAVHSLLIVRHGYLVVEAYFSPSGPDDPYEIYSCTKSVTSALIGIAIGEGKIKSVDARVLDFFPGLQVENPDPRKDAWRLADFLTMRTGLDWPEGQYSYNDARNPLSMLFASRDWAAFVLGRPLVADPGTTFAYSSGASHVLSAVLQAATGQKAEDYARQRLFGPLGITSERWDFGRDGRNTGGWGLHLTPRDMARLGLLYLHDGVWDGRQVVPAEWVQASLTPRVDVVPGRKYGYQWWLRDFGAFAAEGLGGQYILVVPGQDLIVVATEDLAQNADSYLPGLVRDLVVPAAHPAALPPNPAAGALLAASIKTSTGQP